MVLKGRKYIVMFIATAFILVAVLLYYPLFRNFYYSFFDYNGFTGGSTYVGLKFYKTLLGDEIIWKSLFNVLFLLVASLIFQVGISIALAAMVDSIKLGFKFYRTVFFLPVAISGTAIGLMFYMIYGLDDGLLNNFLSLLGFEKVYWLSYDLALFTVYLPAVWSYVGFHFVIMLTAISKVPQEIYESAQLDGITGFKKTIYITIPLIWDVISASTVLIITGVLKTFDIVYIISRGGPMNRTELPSTYMIQKFNDSNFSYGATISVFIIILGLILSFIANKILKKDTITY